MLRAAVAFAVCLPLSAQAIKPPILDRYETGLRLRAVERELAKASDGALRAAGLRELDAAVQAFFRLDLSQVARRLDRAGWALQGRSPEPGQRWAAAVQLSLAPRLVPSSASSIQLWLAMSYDPSVEMPEGCELSIWQPGNPQPRFRAQIREVPCALELPLGDLATGDLTLRATLSHGRSLLAERPLFFARVDELGKRLDQLDSAVGAEDRPAEPGPVGPDLERSTLAWLVEMLRGMTTTKREETVLPAVQMLEEAEGLAASLAARRKHYTATRQGQFWLRVPVRQGTIPVRWLAPPPPEPAPTLRPLIVALHGAGGSENLFFDGYGDGAIVALAAARGWFVVAPRLGMMGGPDVAAVVDVLAERWPIDRNRVAILGHSMGAAAAVATACKHPTRYAAVAALGGGGNVPKRAELGNLRWYVAAGEHDFGRTGALALHQRLEALGANSQFHEFPTVEHLAIVQFALPAVFAHFDAAFAAR
ncbi:MAG: prolyl oligopeptidase family serine peptidase [Planctomycetes bacterium]|nr:prolyl oligopeptidase family serine peptidase [Planctomycetota bacterium]